MTDQAPVYEPGWVCLEGMNLDEFAAYEYGCRQAEDAVWSVVDGKDQGQGSVNEPWKTLRERLLRLKKAEDLLRELHEKCELDSLIDYSSTAAEYEPNRIIRDVNEFFRS